MCRIFRRNRVSPWSYYIFSQHDTVVIFTVEDGEPSIEADPNEMDVHFGERLEWCVSGDSFGVHNLQWAWSQDPDLETVNISDSVSDPKPCLSCECAEEKYYSLSVVQEYVQNKTMGGARGVAFSVLGYKIIANEIARSWQCSGIPNSYLSFVIIDEVEPRDVLTELVFNVTSFTGITTPGNYSIHACMWFSVYV